jgi:hypothetical protein
MTDWEAVQDAKLKLEDLSQEIKKHREAWERVQADWKPVEFSTRIPISPRSYQKSYLAGSMAESLTNANPHRKCFFEASIKEMNAVPRSIPNRIQFVPGMTKPPVQVYTTDKFSTELAGAGSASTEATSMVEFSRFLFELSGERHMADASDPTRALDSHLSNRPPPSMQHDRLIR